MEYPHITTALCLLISFPFSPTFINAGPVHRTKAYVRAKARHEKASDAIRGAPSPWKVLAMMARLAPERTRRLHVSVRLKVDAIATA
jgi:hypothetical protein